MTHLIQILLPLHDNGGKPFARGLYQGVAAELTERFGGVTAFARSPGEGLWRVEGASTESDDVVVFEVMVEDLDPAWWGSYRQQLERRFRQDELVMRATSILRL
jgi:hypothetical protein